MNKSKLKNFAPKARREFIQAVTDRAHFYGLSKGKTEPIKVEGDFAIINGQAFPKAIADQREKLEERIAASSFEQVIEEIAYTWFNRFVAIRYMELHGYMSHGYRVLSNPDPDNSMPEILEKAQHVQLQGLNKEKVIELKMDGTKDEELYRMLLIAQCNELFRWMPFLFENIRDCTELLLPDNLLHSDSLIRKLVGEIEQEDWQEVEIIGWLYQFYISEKKDQVIGKVVKSEDIPAATQLFTPNWIVKYLVQNSLGSQWLRTYPNSPLKEKMEYYIEPAEQSGQVQKRLAEITPDSLNPEELTLLDPACGSGHILVETYDLLKEIYLERGYRRRDIPELILKRNLFGLEIDDRAAQLAGFAVMMKARADDRRLFKKGIVPNIVSIQESKGLDIEDIVTAINEPLTPKVVSDAPRSMEELQDSIEVPLFVSSKPANITALDTEERLTVDDLKALLGLFEHGKTFGSLIRLPEMLAEKLSAMAQRIEQAYTSGQPYAQAQATKIKPFVQQAMIMAGRYDAVVANPPYMGSGYLNPLLKKFMKDEFKGYEKDLFSAFIIRNREFAKNTGLLGFMSPFVWMFISSHEQLRTTLIDNVTLTTLIQLEYSGFAEATVPVCTFTFANNHTKDYAGSFIRLSDFRGADNQAPKTLEAIRNKYCGWFHTAKPDDFKKIPGSPIAYWASEKVLSCFENMCSLSTRIETREGLTTGCNELFLRLWHEVSFVDICFDAISNQDAKEKNKRWFSYIKGGDFRRWAGNYEFIVNWENDGSEVRSFDDPATGRIRSHNYNGDYAFKKGFTWSGISSGTFAVRNVPEGFMFDAKGPMGFSLRKDNLEICGAFLNSKVTNHFIKMLAPTLDFKLGHVLNLPYAESLPEEVNTNCKNNINYSKSDWDSFETSWDFEQLPLLSHKSSLPGSYGAYHENCKEMTTRMKELEEENNQLFIEAYDLEDELTPDVPDEQITLFANPKYRYGGKLSEEELEKRFKEDTIKELLSYSIGCIMGRYSLDETGLIYAQSGNEGFDSSQYTSFPADDDGIIPITDQYWFNDDAAERFFEFVKTVWPKNTQEENLDFVAEAIGRKSRETSKDAIRRYFVTGFFKDHLKTYKKRPIYWLFSSGKEKTLQCLVYIHRYNEGTLSRMRTEYLIPLQGRIASKIDSLKKDMEHTSSTSAANKIRKEIAKLAKQAEELRKYDEKLHHYADMKIKLDLDDGVKVNYGKFGDLLAEVKTVTGKKE